jgi:transposase
MARPISFSVQEGDVSRLVELRYQHPHPRVQQRCWLLWLVSRGMSLTQASDLAGVSRITGWRYGEVYREKGLDGLLAEHWEGPQSGLIPHVPTVAEAVERIEQLTGVQRKPTQVALFLRDTLGLCWRRTAAIPCPPKKTSPSTSRCKPAS